MSGDENLTEDIGSIVERFKSLRVNRVRAMSGSGSNSPVMPGSPMGNGAAAIRLPNVTKFDNPTGAGSLLSAAASGTLQMSPTAMLGGGDHQF